MFLIVFLSVITAFIVIVPILIFMCTEVEEETVPEYKFSKEPRKPLNIAKDENIENNAEEISVNAGYHVGFEQDGQKNSDEIESPEKEPLSGSDNNTYYSDQSESSKTYPNSYSP